MNSYQQRSQQCKITLIGRDPLGSTGRVCDVDWVGEVIRILLLVSKSSSLKDLPTFEVGMIANKNNNPDRQSEEGCK